MSVQVGRGQQEGSGRAVSISGNDQQSGQPVEETMAWGSSKLPANWWNTAQEGCDRGRYLRW